MGISSMVTPHVDHGNFIMKWMCSNLFCSNFWDLTVQSVQLGGQHITEPKNPGDTAGVVTKFSRWSAGSWKTDQQGQGAGWI